MYKSLLEALNQGQNLANRASLKIYFLVTEIRAPRWFARI